MEVPSLGWEDPLEEGMANRSSILAGRIPWTWFFQAGKNSWQSSEQNKGQTSLDVLRCCTPRKFKVPTVPYGEGNGTPLQYSCLENPMDGGAWKAVIHGVAEGRTWLSDFTFIFHFHALEKEMSTHSSVLAWRIPRILPRGSLVGCRLWGRTESDTTEAT